MTANAPVLPCILVPVPPLYSKSSPYLLPQAYSTVTQLIKHLRDRVSVQLVEFVQLAQLIFQQGLLPSTTPHLSPIDLRQWSTILQRHFVKQLTTRANLVLK